jgi:hypothetical protein
MGLGRQQNLFSNPHYLNIAVIYDTSRAGLHLWVV